MVSRANPGMVSQVRHPRLRAGQKMDLHARSLIRLCATALVFAGLTLAAGAEDYASWMASHAKQELGRRGPALRFVATQFTEPDLQKPGARPNPFDSESSEGI